MSESIKEIRTTNKQLLVGVITKIDNKMYFVVRNRGKEDCIEINTLIDIFVKCNLYS